MVKQGDVVKKDDTYYLVGTCKPNSKSVYAYKIEDGILDKDCMYYLSRKSIEKVDVCKSRIDATNLRKLERNGTNIIVEYRTHEKVFNAVKDGIKVFKFSNIDEKAVYVSIISATRTARNGIPFRLHLQIKKL